MEAIGQLASGVTYDFNDVLQGVTSSPEMMQRRMKQNRVGERRPPGCSAPVGAARGAPDEPQVARGRRLGLPVLLMTGCAEAGAAWPGRKRSASRSRWTCWRSGLGRRWIQSGPTTRNRVGLLELAVVLVAPVHGKGSGVAAGSSALLSYSDDFAARQRPIIAHSTACASRRWHPRAC